MSDELYNIKHRYQRLYEIALNRILSDFCITTEQKHIFMDRLDQEVEAAEYEFKEESKKRLDILTGYITGRAKSVEQLLRWDDYNEEEIEYFKSLLNMNKSISALSPKSQC